MIIPLYYMSQEIFSERKQCFCKGKPEPQRQFEERGGVEGHRWNNPKWKCMEVSTDHTADVLVWDVLALKHIINPLSSPPLLFPCVTAHPLYFI